MIKTIEDFLDAFDEHSSARIASGFGEEEFYYGDFWGTMNAELDPDFIRTLERLGILYLFGGALEINPMAIRILKRMQYDGKELSADSFHREVEYSKELYHVNHMDGEMEGAVN